MGILENLFGKKIKNENLPQSEQVTADEHQLDVEALREFCTLILGQHHENVYQRCKFHMENAKVEEGGIPSVLYVLSGQDSDDNDPYGIKREDQLVKTRYYLISSDAGAPNLSDFFDFIEEIMKARGLSFEIDKEKFSNDECIIEWLAELSTQLKDLYIVNFDGAGDDYHFTIMNKEDCEKAMALFTKISDYVIGYSYKSMIITENFTG